MSKMIYIHFVNRFHLLSFFYSFYFLISLNLNTHPCPTGTCPFQCLSCIHLFSYFFVLKPLMHLICSTLIPALPTTQPHFSGPLFSICSASTHSPVLFFPTCCTVPHPCEDYSSTQISHKYFKLSDCVFHLHTISGDHYLI